MRLRRLSVTAVLAATAAVVAAAPALAAPVATQATAPADGTLLSAAPIQVAYLGAAAQKIGYATTDSTGASRVVTGTVLSPRSPWRGPGPRPLTSFAVGTIGQGDQCAPSTLFQQGLEYEAATIAPLLLAGETVVVTDYIGLGTPGVHTYVNRVDEGHAVLDAARAAQQLGTRDPAVDVAADGPVGLYGYSQGGGAVAAAAELAPTYAPELDLVGAAAGAPPADLAATAAQLDGTALTGLLGYAVNSLAASYPAVATALPPLLNARGQQVLAETATQCVAATALRYAFNRTSQYTVSGQPLTAFLGQEPFASAVAAQQIGTLTPTAPVYIWQGRNDDVVPYAQSRQLAADWCGKGADVTFRRYDIAPTFPGYGFGHALPAIVGLPEAQAWLYQRYLGTPATDGCAALPPTT
ncbi:lipase family protein [Rhodococcus aerolatus]